ncbi:alpha-ketoglutarate-dependent dioxygenase AlkB family protein [Polynucleobacter brandtiae]|uniref:Alkylated DNA repair dioxygenase AlkB n=1 Tax=Polynucleobacter brandtiae TaxID=1938816 RepID=A0A2M8VZ77_9BURK|nr:alpha-ketoglutarate-dependent dioxygenase AlkB [Polynucleobacter brandtiae]PJI83162.1 alkylated DNA repair dioxygenase AlkB [Polynucleobacter brandtiae]
MNTPDLPFEDLGSNSLISVLTRDGQAHYLSAIFPQDQSNELLQILIRSVLWQPDQVMMFGKVVTTRRKVAWIGDPDCSYTYSGIERQPQAWTPALLLIKAKAEALSGCQFNSCLANLYHSGDEGMGWHSDNEKELDSNMPIASFSLGGRRKFAFRHREDQETVSLFLENGSLLIMHPPIQEYWRHSLLKTKTLVAPRINLTFRKIQLA